EEAARLIAQPQRMARAFALGLAANLLVLGEYALLLAAFGLPSGPVAVVAAVFATGAAHSLPIPAAVGALEGAELWLFGMLGHPPAVGLAVGLVVRLREVAWIVPGILYLMMRAPGLTRGALTTPPDPCTRAPEPRPPGRSRCEEEEDDDARRGRDGGGSPVCRPCACAGSSAAGEEAGDDVAGCQADDRLHRQGAARHPVPARGHGREAPDRQSDLRRVHGRRPAGVGLERE